MIYGLKNIVNKITTSKKEMALLLVLAVLNAVLFFKNLEDEKKLEILEERLAFFEAKMTK